MAYKLAVEDKLNVTVKGKLNSAVKGTGKPFNFSLTALRMDQDAITATLSDGESIKDFLLSKVTGWEGQRLVLNEDDTPAEFCAAALGELMRVPGMAVWCFQAYMRDVGVQEKN